MCFACFHFILIEDYRITKSLESLSHLNDYSCSWKTCRHRRCQQQRTTSDLLKQYWLICNCADSAHNMAVGGADSCSVREHSVCVFCVYVITNCRSDVATRQLFVCCYLEALATIFRAVTATSKLSTDVFE